MSRESWPPRPQREKPEHSTTARRDKPAGVQGRNVGYWQADGATRSAAKRSKRP